MKYLCFGLKYDENLYMHSGKNTDCPRRKYTLPIRKRWPRIVSFFTSHRVVYEIVDHPCDLLYLSIVYFDDFPNTVYPRFWGIERAKRFCLQNWGSLKPGDA